MRAFVFPANPEDVYRYPPGGIPFRCVTFGLEPISKFVLQSILQEVA